MSETFDKDRLQQILDEVSEYSVDLEPDPTLPHLGTKYLQKVISDCRNYMNRVMHYIQLIKIQEKNTRIQLKASELDLERKMAEKLSDDALVRKQPSIEDRKALAATMLSEENLLIAQLKADLLDIEETAKLIKIKYDHLRGTSQDIKSQRSLVKDDMMARLGGDNGFEKPTVNQDRSVPNGMTAPVTTDDLNPIDILDPNRRAEDLPIPKDSVHAQMIHDFYSGQSSQKFDLSKPSEEIKSINYTELLDD